MGVQAGDAFWFVAATWLTVVSDLPVGAVIVQFYPARQGGDSPLRQQLMPGQA